MWSSFTPALREEIQRFRLVFTCEDCLHFVRAAGDPGACDLLYPTEPHRSATVEAARDGDPIIFCKMFEAR